MNNEPRPAVAKGEAMAEPAEATTPDRSWWARIYCAGIKADLNKQPRMPPEGLTDDQRDVWLAGYGR